MSDPSAAPNSGAQGFQGLPAQPQAPAAPAAPVAPAVSPQGPQLSEYGQSMLNQIPEAERQYVEKYIGQWDAGLQRQVQEVQARYAPYEPYTDFDPDDLEMATRVWDMFNQDPTGTIEMLQKAAQQQSGFQPPPQPQYQPQQSAQGPPTGQYGAQQGQGFVPQIQQQPQYAQLPPHVEQMLQRQQTFMEQMAMTQQQQIQAQQEMAEDQQFEQYLETLHRELGDFDDNIVINNLASGMDPAQAVQAFRSQWQPVAQGGNGGPPVPPPVPVLNGGSAVPGQVPIAQASTQQRFSVVKQMLDHANQS